MVARHRWLIVAPRFSHQNGVSPRDTAPVIQKYDTSDLVNVFLKDPRRSLPFASEDLVHRVVKLNVNRFLNLDYRATDTRKLFLDTHKRFYLVVCEVQCDALGFPSVDRNAICESGFVIRRREWTFTHTPDREGFARVRRDDGLLGLAPLREAALARGGREVLQRWVPHPQVDGVGSWIDVASEPNVPPDTIYPLHPLIPDPREVQHAGAGRTIYFGLIPTASSELDPRGRPRFDDDSVYEIRAFVRQHKVPCPRKPTRADCPGPLIWSRPTEAYQLAAPFDLIGTSYRTVNVKTPDLRTLKAQAAIPNVGLRAPVRFNLPDRSGVEIRMPTLPVPGGPTLISGVCFRNIPLTTIVAMFVYNIFKPIVISLFQLYHLLPLEFCIPAPGSPAPPSPPQSLRPPTEMEIEEGQPPVNVRDEIDAATPRAQSLADVPALAPEPEEMTV